VNASTNRVGTSAMNRRGMLTLLVAGAAGIEAGGRAASAQASRSPEAQRPALGFIDLKRVGPDQIVHEIRLRHDGYLVTTADGRTLAFAESNLRFRTDSSATGPHREKPVIIPTGMMGDRASVFFAAPDEISTFVKDQC
jgi:cytochrome c